jgi:hypothetical protein
MTALSAALQFPPEVPLHLQRIEVEVAYKLKAAQDGFPADRATELASVAENLAALVRAGFLCRPFGPDATARIAVKQSAPDRLIFGYAGRGAHVNLLVVMLRLIHRYHQTPPGVHEELLAAAEDPAEVAAYFTPMVFGDLISSIAPRQLVAVAGSPMRAAPDATRALSQDMPVPASGPLGADPVLEAELVRVKGAVPPPDPTVEDHWLSVSQFAVFLPPGHDPAFEPGDEGFFEGQRGKALEVEEISIEQVFLFEFLNLLANGKLPGLAVEAT